MDPSYNHKKIVDLSDAELVALGFLGDNVAVGVKRIVEQARANPKYLGTVTCFMLDCLKRKHPMPPPQQEVPLSPAPPTHHKAEASYSNPSHDSDIYTAISPDLVSKYEMNFWYHGISGDPPKLMWRSDFETNAFPTPPPGARFFNVPTKTAHGVFNTPLNDVWDDVAPQILASIKARGLKYSALKTARFSTIEDGGNESLGPIVVWIAVHPNTTDARAVRDATPDILRILAGFGITSVVVEWYEASVARLAGPPLMSIADHGIDPKFGLNHPFNVGLGVPIARQSDDAQGTLTLLFREMKNRSGGPSERILGLTSKHVASADTATDYEFDGANPQHILVCGDHRLARAITEIEDAVATGLHDVAQFAREVEDLKSKSVKSQKDSRLLIRKQNTLDYKSEDNDTLQTFLGEVRAHWKNSDGRRFGVVDWAPKISANVDDHHYTRDIATFAVDTEKLENFERNAIDLGNQYTCAELEDLFWPAAAIQEGREFPASLQLPIRRVLTRRLASNPDTKDKNGNPLFIVGKYGNTTKLTIGRYSGMDAYICTDHGVESREMAVYNYSNAFGIFADYGDSGSLIFTGDGDALAILHSGMPGGEHNHVTYGTPIWWVIQQVLDKYPFAEFYGIAHNLD